MVDFKGTPGPWFVIDSTGKHSQKTGKYTGTFDIINREQYEVGMKVIGEAKPYGGEHFPELDEASANARLIAASPDMIAELKNNHEFLLQLYSALDNRNGLDFDSIQQSLRDRMAKQLSLIDKATS
jgi:hypothetical protein